jgi:hypothetical protein
MKFFLPLLAALLCFVSAGVAQSADLSAFKGFNQTVKLNSKIESSDVFSAVEHWFNANPALFTSKNAEPAFEAKAKNKADVEDAYANRTPLRSLDPASNKLIGQGLIKYYGGKGASIQLMYLKYDITVEIKTGEAAFRISNLRYYHFDAKNYTDAGIFAYGGGKPCEHTGTMEYLVDCQTSPTEFQALADFFQQTVKAQGKAFGEELKAKKMLPAPATKPVVKPVAKKTTKAKPTVQKAVVKQ